jgi:hypothetical protein
MLQGGLNIGMSMEHGFFLLLDILIQNLVSRVSNYENILKF